MRGTAKVLILSCLLLYTSAWIYRIYTRKYYTWLPDYLRWSFTHAEPSQGPVHIFFFCADDFEPGEHPERMQRWERDYPELARRHRDSTGRPLQHTWFYPGDDIVDENLQALKRLTGAGYGEVELHLHHSNDTKETAARKYREAIESFQRFGFLLARDGQTHFAFAHGNNGLDNSMGPRFCGVNRELQLLRELGCFADFTFPAVWTDAQPSKVNTIIDAADDDAPKSYGRRGVPVRAGSKPYGDLLIFQGPLLFSAQLDLRRLFLPLEDGDVHAAVPLTAQRVDLWVRANIHVAGRPNWVFVKVATHGAGSDAEADENLGPHMDQALSYMEKKYNDGIYHVLHYVTAREAYNLVRAAADGRQGDPGGYLNSVIPPYVADSGS